MKAINMVHSIAGLLIIGSLGLGYFYHHYFFLITLFVGLNLFQFGFTDFCPLEKLLKRLGAS